jgi:AcrR family transcriptional regulator
MAADQEAFGRAGSGARPAGRGQRRAGRRKVAVLEAAGRVIAERGADATRFADVAAESGVPVSTLQYYFGSREDLLVAAFRHASGTEIAALEANLAGLDDPWEQLAHVVTSALRGYQADAGAAGAGATRAGATGAAGSGRLWIESWHFGIRDAEMRADALRDYGAWRELVADVVRRGTEAGTFAPRLSPEQIAVLTIALVDGVGIPLALDDPAITPDGAVADVLSALAGLLHPPA